MRLFPEKVRMDPLRHPGALDQPLNDSTGLDIIERPDFERRKHTGITVDVALTKIANIAWKKVIAVGENPDNVKIMLDNATVFIQDLCETIPTGQLIQPALDRACDLNISSTMHFATAVNHKGPLFTSDKDFSSAARKAPRVMLLE